MIDEWSGALLVAAAEERVPLGVGIGAGALLLVTGVACLIAARMAGEGRLPRNEVIGIRTKRSLSSDENWLIMHRTAAPYMWWSSMAWLALVPVMVLVRQPLAMGVLVGIGSVLGVALLLLGSRKGTRALDAAASGTGG